MEPKTWNELLDAGYVVELTEDQLTDYRIKMMDDQRPFSYKNDDHLKSAQENELRMRGKKCN